MVLHTEVMDVFKRVANKEIIPFIKPGTHNWEETFCGNVSFIVAGWEIVIFNDCDDWDYVDSVVSPDGRTGEYEDWESKYDDSGELLKEYREPDDLLENDVYLAMKDIFIKAGYA